MAVVTYDNSQASAEALAHTGHVATASSALVGKATCMGAVTQYAFAELVDDGTTSSVQLPGTAGNRCFCITLAAGADGDEIPVCLDGLCLLTLGATLTTPATLSAATTGKGIAATTGHNIMADLLEDGVDTDVKWVRLYGGGSGVA